MSDYSIEFVRWPSDASEWHIRFRAIDREYRIEQEFYSDPAILLDFANRLSAFPTRRSDEVVFEVGSKSPSWAHWVFLRAFIVDAGGHAAITIDVGNNGDVLRSRSARFTIGCDVASINLLGNRLAQWLDEPNASLHQTLHSS